MNPFDNPQDQPQPQPENKPAPRVRKKFPPFNLEGHYYETRGRRMLVPTEFGLQELSCDDFMIRLHRKHGYSIKGKFNDARNTVSLLQEEQWVHVATQLAGYSGPQVIVHGGKRILILEGPDLIPPFEGEHPVIDKILGGMLPGEQGEHLLCWSADVVRASYERRAKSFIVPILCGPSGAGKSLYQEIMTRVTGGRMSRPFSYLTGATSFNEHLFAAEHWVIEDEYSSGDQRSRAQLGTAIKNFVANKTKLNNGKGKCAFVMPPLLQFMTVTLNDGLENVMQLPRKHPALDDKASLYEVRRVPMPMPTGTDEEKEAFWAAIEAELPCWIYDLIHHTPMPEKWRSGRFMVPWRAEPVSKALDELEPYMKLRELIRIWIWSDPSNKNDVVFTIVPIGKSYYGTPTQIENDLRHSTSQVKTLADDLLRNPTECGRLLTRLCEHFPHEFEKKRASYGTVYRLNPPEAGDMEECESQ